MRAPAIGEEKKAFDTSRYEGLSEAQKIVEAARS
jgi:hypothetical protein